MLEAIYQQTFPNTDMEVIIADGMSDDATRDEIDTFKGTHPDLDVRVVDNVARTIPAGLNCAIQAAQGNYIIRMDAHARPYPDYVSRCIDALNARLGNNVGGVWEIKPGGQNWIAKSIATAAAHPFGVGDAGYRIGAQASEVDTVPFGSFRRSLLDEIGFFDETLLANEDYEFNARIRKNGGRIWLDPEIVTVYYARATLTALKRQYWRYGFWKYRMLQRYPETLRWRQAIPPAFVFSLIGLIIFSWLPIIRWILILEISLYGVVLFLTGLTSSIHYRKVYLFIGLPLSIVIMHLAWGSGFLWSMIASIMENRIDG